jgi:hypothetical protein
MQRRLLLLVLLESLVLALLIAHLLRPAPAAPSAAATDAPAEARGAASAGSVATPAGGSGAPAQRTGDERRVALPSAAPASGAAGVLVHGTVRSDAGAAIAEASVTLQRGDVYASGGTTADGDYAVPGLAAGPWRLYARAAGFAPLELDITLDESAHQRRDLVLTPSYVVHVRLRAEGDQDFDAEWSRLTGHVTDPTVIATEAPLEGALGITEQGSALWAGVADWQSEQRELHLHRPPPVYAHLLMRHLVLASQPIARGQTEIEFTLDPQAIEARLARVRMRVVDAAGAPIAGAGVSIQTAQGGGARGQSGADGLVDVARVMPGLSALQVHADGREQVWTHIKLGPGETLDLGDFSLSEPIEVRGHCRDAQGNPVRATLQWTDLERWRFPQPTVDRRHAICEPEKGFQLYGVGRSRYLLRAVSDDRQRIGWVLVDTTQGPLPDVEVRLQPAVRVELQPRFPPTQSHVVSARDAGGSLCASALVHSGRRAQGIWLIAGAYTIEIHDQDDRLVRTSRIVVGDAPLTLEVP